MLTLQKMNWILWKTVSIVLIVIAATSLMGCSIFAGQAAATEDTAYLTPISRETLEAYQWDTPVRNKMEAVIASRRNLDTAIYMFYTEEPTVVSVEEMRREDALKRVAQPSVINIYEARSGDMNVWLVIFEGEWQMIVPPAAEHPVATPEPPSRGCVYVIIDANDSRHSEIGTTKCSS